MIVSPFLALFAGLVSFLSPCVLPLIPSYLSFLMDSSLMKEPWSKKIRSTLIIRSLGFIAGFTVIFIALSIVFTLGLSFLPISILNIISGSIIILLALHILFNIFPFLNYEKRPTAGTPPRSFFSAFPIGMAFSAGWTPCIGPILASILLLAAQEGSLSWSILLLLLYSIGLGIPFLLLSFFYPKVHTFVHRSKKHLLTLKIITGTILLVLGLVILFDRIKLLNGLLIRASSQILQLYTEHTLIVSIILAAIYSVGIVFTLISKRLTHWYIKLGISAVLATLIFLEFFASISIIHGLSWYLRFQGI